VGKAIGPRVSAGPMVCPPFRRVNACYWQRRYWEHAIRDDVDLERHVDYIHFNPVKHRHVTRVVDWPHSSFHRYVERGLLAADWGGNMKEIQAAFGE
jgi:putative transposase